MMMMKATCTTSWRRAQATWSQLWLSSGLSTPSYPSCASSATTVSRCVCSAHLHQNLPVYWSACRIHAGCFRFFVPSRFLWLSLRERRSWPESWSLMESMSLSSPRMTTSRASGTDWCSTLRKTGETVK